MDSPILTVEEREAINTGRWFSSLSPSLRHDILRCSYVKRYKDGDLITARGDLPEEWMACAKGAVRVSSSSLSGKQITLTYVEPGVWFGDMSLFDGNPRTHDAYAHGDTTTLCVARNNFKKILALHVELYEALLHLYALYKQGSEGDVSGPKPGFFDFVGTAKYEAWAKLAGSSQDDAMKKYVDLVKKLIA